MRVLVACEFSGVVRDAFARKGHDAWSCDLLPATSFPGQHIQGDVREVLNDGWDLMIAFPPCTHLAVSGARHFHRKHEVQRESLMLFLDILNAPIPRIAVENPVSVVSTRLTRPTQIIHPWQFGHPESKTTCLWLRWLPLLVPTNVLPKPSSGVWENQTPSGQNKLGPSPDRWMKRSRTYQGIADAMADQWGKYGS